MKYNLSRIMTNANAYAKIMSRGDALRKAWANEKAQVSVQAIKATPSQFRKGDRIAISVGALDGKIDWYTFSGLDGDFSFNEVVALFEIGKDWPCIDFVLAKNTQYVVERAAVVAIAA
ncbi:hypothetical protein LJC74_05640 [Eubacteriales bacterium OttesenSCG-928-A19]|nr:hypothetical protein [Eubacteriales bacterium OttesenSCG-928-A19]